MFRVINLLYTFTFPCEEKKTVRLNYFCGYLLFFVFFILTASVFIVPFFHSLRSLPHLKSKKKKIVTFEWLHLSDGWPFSFFFYVHVNQHNEWTMMTSDKFKSGPQNDVVVNFRLSFFCCCCCYYYCVYNLIHVLYKQYSDTITWNGV